MTIRIVGDIHGQMDRYLKLVEQYQYSIQIGDLGHKEHYKTLKENLNPENHIFIVGNHDDYNNLPAHARKGYGMINHGGMEFFYISGAQTMDKEIKQIRNEWWEQEELTYTQLLEAIREYETHKPDIIISHTCPSIVKDSYMLKKGHVPRQSRTEFALQSMYETHKPKLWIFGHFHKQKRIKILGTYFICLDMLEALDYDLNKTVEENVNHILPF